MVWSWVLINFRWSFLEVDRAPWVPWRWENSRRSGKNVLRKIEWRSAGGTGQKVLRAKAHAVGSLTRQMHWASALVGMRWVSCVL